MSVADDCGGSDRPPGPGSCPALDHTLLQILRTCAESEAVMASRCGETVAMDRDAAACTVCASCHVSGLNLPFVSGPSMSEPWTSGSGRWAATTQTPLPVSTAWVPCLGPGPVGHRPDPFRESWGRWSSNPGAA